MFIIPFLQDQNQSYATSLPKNHYTSPTGMYFHPIITNYTNHNNYQVPTEILRFVL